MNSDGTNVRAVTNNNKGCFICIRWSYDGMRLFLWQILLMATINPLYMINKDGQIYRGLSMMIPLIGLEIILKGIIKRILSEQPLKQNN
jgi:hypothetical protein